MGGSKLAEKLFRRGKAEKKTDCVKTADADADSAAPDTSTAATATGGELVNAERERIMSDVRKKGGVFSYIVGITICAVMFVVNLVSLILL